MSEAESAIESADMSQSQGWEPTGTLEQMRKELRVSIESTVEKTVMEIQMNKSKVYRLCRPLSWAAYYAASPNRTSGQTSSTRFSRSVELVPTHSAPSHDWMFFSFAEFVLV